MIALFSLVTTAVPCVYGWQKLWTDKIQSNVVGAGRNEATNAVPSRNWGFRAFKQQKNGNNSKERRGSYALCVNACVCTNTCWVHSRVQRTTSSIINKMFHLMRSLYAIIIVLKCCVLLGCNFVVVIVIENVRTGDLQHNASVHILLEYFRSIVNEEKKRRYKHHPFFAWSSKSTFYIHIEMHCRWILFRNTLHTRKTLLSWILQLFCQSLHRITATKNRQTRCHVVGVSALCSSLLAHYVNERTMHTRKLPKQPYVSRTSPPPARFEWCAYYHHRTHTRQVWQYCSRCKHRHGRMQRVVSKGIAAHGLHEKK